MSEHETGADVERVTRFMRGVAARMSQDQHLPDAAVVLARARLAEWQRHQERTLKPAAWSWKFTKYWLFGVFLFCVVRFSTEIAALADGFGARLVQSIGSLVSAPSASAWVPVLVVVVAHAAWKLFAARPRRGQISRN